MYQMKNDSGQCLSLGSTLPVSLTELNYDGILLSLSGISWGPRIYVFVFNKGFYGLNRQFRSQFLTKKNKITRVGILILATLL